MVRGAVPGQERKGIKNGKQFLEFENNLYVYNEDGNYTNEILKIYNKIQIN